MALQNLHPRCFMARWNASSSQVALELQDVLRHVFQPLGDAVAVHPAGHQGLEDEQYTPLLCLQRNDWIDLCGTPRWERGRHHPNNSEQERRRNRGEWARLIGSRSR